jgi:plasmid stabilization system protein ParE
MLTPFFHRLVQRDVHEILEYYHSVSGEKLADDFYELFLSHVRLAAGNPSGFHFDAPGLRRVNLPRFPFHFLYRVRRDSILVLVVRHHQRNPSFGLKRR